MPANEKEKLRTGIEAVTKEIRGEEFSCAMFPPKEGTRIAFDLYGIMGPYIARNVEAIGLATIDGGYAEVLVSNAVLELAYKAENKETRDRALELIDELFAYVSVKMPDGRLRKLDMSIDFTGQYDFKAEVLRWVIEEVNDFMGFFSNFFNDLVENVGVVRSLKKGVDTLLKENPELAVKKFNEILKMASMVTAEQEKTESMTTSEAS